MVVNHLQEAPAGTPWVNDRVRTWTPGPFDPVEYERYARWCAKHRRIRGRPASRMVIDDPLLSPHVAESDRRRKEP